MNLKLSVIGILLFLFFQQCYPQILSIDFGTQYIKASLVHSGAGKSFSIVENAKSQRKFINSLSFLKGERFYESQSLSKRSKTPGNCWIYSKLLIDLHINPSVLSVVKRELILEYIGDLPDDKLMASFMLQNFPFDMREISLLEVTAMMLKYVKQAGEKVAKGSIKDSVLIVPNYWNIHQRQFLIQAAEIADLYVISIITENVAASINYALSQRNTNSTETILFYNIGASSFQMTLVRYQQIKTEKSQVESIFILDDYGVPYAGGLRLDFLLFQYFKLKFEEKHQKQLSRRGQIKLLAESQKAKYVLSANKEATIYIEGLMDGIDFIASITRQQFQELAQPVFQNFISPLKTFLFDNDLRAQDLSSIQLIGGTVRIPKIQAMLSHATENKINIGTHINGDQAMALGAAFYGANSSKKFKVKGANLFDGFNFQVRLVLKNLDSNIQQDHQHYYHKNITLFKKKSRFGLIKEINFKCKQNLLAQLYKEDQEGIQLLKSYKIEDIQDINQTKFKVSMMIEINPVTIVNLNGAKYTYQKETTQYYTEKVKVIKNKTIKLKNQNKQQKEQVQQKTEEQKESQKAEESQNKYIEQSQEEMENKSQSDEQIAEENSKKEEKRSKNKKKSKKAKDQYETVQKSKNVTKTYSKTLNINVSFSLFNQSSVQSGKEAKILLRKFESKEQSKRKLVQSKNKLESLIYEIKDKIQTEEFIQFAQREQIDNLKQLVQEKGLWYQDSVSNEIQQFKKHFRQLNYPVDKIKKRMVENRERESVYQRSLYLIKEYSALTLKIQKGKPWITDQQVQGLKQQISKAKAAVEQILDKLNEVAINVDYIYRNKDMIKEADFIKDRYFELKSKSKPKNYKVPDKQEKQEKEEGKEEEKEDEL